MLRISQVWNEITENWQPRGTWLFLELIEKYEQETHLGVSVKQIWYDLRDKTCFDKIKEWTCTMRDLWKVLVLQVINENLNIILKHVFKVLECSGGLFQETNGGLELARTDVGVDISSEADLANALAIVPIENSFCSDM
ncbi:increased dna methylation 1 [Fagus crenata]